MGTKISAGSPNQPSLAEVSTLTQSSAGYTQHKMYLRQSWFLLAHHRGGFVHYDSLPSELLEEPVQEDRS